MLYLESISENKEDIIKLKELLNMMALKTNETNYHVCFESFNIVNKIVNTYEKVQNGATALCKSLIDDGVKYVEIRTSIKDFGLGYEEYIKSVLIGLQNGSKNTNLKICLILSLRRNCSIELANETLRLILLYNKNNIYNINIVGLDISDNAMLGDGNNIYKIVNILHENNIPITLHLGECIEETATQQLNELIIYKPKRIGHGVFLCDAAKEYIFKNKLPIEMCITSAVIAHMINNYNEHPALELLKNNYPVCICTDDPLIFQTNLTNECNIIMNLLGYNNNNNEEEYNKIINELQHNAYKYSFDNDVDYIF